VHPVTKIAPGYLLVELGPLLVLGTVGMILLAVRPELRHSRSLLGLFALALLFGLFLRIPREPNIAIRKAIKVAELPLVVFAGGAVLAVLSSPRRREWTLAGALVVIPGLATLGTDTAQYLDLAASRFPPTTYVSPDELKMLDWIRTNTPAEVVLQTVNPDRLFGQKTDLLIPALAQRRTFFGNDEMPSMFQVPLPRIEQRKEKVRALHVASEPPQMLGVLQGLPPLYLYVDEGSDGPVRALQQLEATGLVREIHRCGRFSLKVMHPAPGASAGNLSHLGHTER
jgi:hypothetical protein